MANSNLEASLRISAGVQGLNHISSLIDEIEEAGGEVADLRSQFRLLASGFDDLPIEEQNRQFNELQREARETANALNNSADNTQRLNRNMGGASKAIGGLQSMLATLGVTMGASELLQMAEAFKGLEAKIKLATGEGANFVSGMEGVQEIANSTFSSLEDTGVLFTRIARAGEAMGLAQQEVLKITETINKAVQVGGGSVESNQAAITQLIQGLQSGVLRGDEFNSVMEQSPRLAMAMADGLGVPIGQLRAMAQEGKLTSEVVISSMQVQADVIAKEFDSLPLTVGNSLTQLKNNMMIFVGDIDKEINSSSGLASAISGISDGIENIDPVALDAIREMFAQLATVAKAVYDVVAGSVDSLNDFTNALSGVEDGADSVNVLVRILQTASVAVAGLADGLFVIENALTTVFSGWTLIFGNIVKGLEFVTGASSEFGSQMIENGNKMLASMTQSVVDYQSKSGQAFSSMAETAQDKLTQTANNARLKYEQMAQDGKTSLGKLEEVFISYAQKSIQASDGIITKAMEVELAENNLKASIDKNGNAVIEKANKVQQASDIETLSYQQVQAEIANTQQSLQQLTAEQKKVEQSDGKKSLKYRQLSQDIDDVTARIAQLNDSQLSSSQRLNKQIAETTSRLQELNNKAKEFEGSGDVGSDKYRQLQQEIDGTKARLQSLNSESSEFGGLLKNDLDKASGAFKTLGLDMGEFATGISSKISEPLKGFSQVASLVKDDTHRLALAYNATAEKIGTSKQAQQLLNAELLKSVNGNQQLANAVKQQAQEQANAKNAIDGQAQALQALGINMDAVNNKMSASGQKMVSNLKIGLSAIKEQATSAQGLKTAIAQALDVSVASAKTQADFQAIKKAIDDAGLASQATSEQMKLINTGASGGEDAVKKLAQSTKQATKATKQNSQAQQQNSQARQTQKAVIEEVTQADNQATAQQKSNATRLSSAIAMVRDSMKSKLSVLTQMGATTGQVDNAFKNLMSNEVFEGQRWASFEQYAHDMQSLNNEIDRQVAGFTNARDSAIKHTQALSGQNVSANNLVDAKHALRKATQANINGLVRMDSQTLSSLQNAIDSTKSRLDNLANSAKDTADSLEASLARMKGNEDKAREIDQAKKLADIEIKLQEAKQRGNAEEITQLERALNLQKQINAVEDKKARQQQREQSQRRQAPQPRTPTPPPRTDELVNAIDNRTRDMLRKEGANEMMNQLLQQMKSRAI